MKPQFKKGDYVWYPFNDKELVGKIEAIGYGDPNFIVVRDTEMALKTVREEKELRKLTELERAMHEL